MKPASPQPTDPAGRLKPEPLSSANRREFLRGSARYTALAVLGLVAGKVLGRRSASACVNQSVCGSCPVLTGCTLPQALTTKEVKPTSAL